MIDPQLKTEKIDMRQSAPGRYEAKIATPRRGSYQIDLAQAVSGGQPSRQARGVVVGYPEELRLQPTNETLLRRIGQASGGGFAPTVSQILQPDGRTALKPVSVWPFLLMAAASMFLFDVFLRRVELSRR